jgi:hypothetical protein
MPEYFKMSHQLDLFRISSLFLPLHIRAMFSLKVLSAIVLILSDLEVPIVGHGLLIFWTSPMTIERKCLGLMEAKERTHKPSNHLYV